MNRPLVKTSLIFVIIAGGIRCLLAEKRTTDRLADQADAVVVADVQSGRQSGYAVAFVLSIIRTIKGDLLPGATVNVSWGCALRANKDLQGNYGLWFLRKAGVSQWTLLAVLQGQIPFEFAYFHVPRVSTPPSVNTTRSASVNDLMAAELVGALEVYTDPSLRHPLAIELVGIGESAVAPDLYRALRLNSDPELKFVGLAGLLSANDMSALAQIANNVNLITNLNARGFVSDAISGRRDADPSAVQYLGKIALSPDSGLQWSAAQALKYIHTRDTLPFLARLLDSNNARIREAGMIGLSRFVDNLPIATPENTHNGKDLIPQGPAPYRTAETDKYSLSRRWLGSANEIEYLQFWKFWWATMQFPAVPVTPPGTSGVRLPAPF